MKSYKDKAHMRVSSDFKTCQAYSVLICQSQIPKSFSLFSTLNFLRVLKMKFVFLVYCKVDFPENLGYTC